MSGPLFNDVAVSLSNDYNIILYTGHKDTLSDPNISINLKVKKTIEYNSTNLFSRLMTSIVYLLQITPSILLEKKHLVIIVSNPPILGIYFYIVNKFKNNNFIYYIYDIYPDVLVAKNIFTESNLIIKIWRRINSILYKKSIYIFTLSDSMKDILSFNNQNLKNKIFVTYPWIDTNFIKPIEKFKNPYLLKFTNHNTFNILYSGNFGSSHDFSTLLNSAKNLNNLNEIKFIFIGRGSKKNDILSYITEFKLNNVNVFDFQSADIFPYSLAISDISIVTIEENIEKLMIPSKLFSYLAIGSPIIAIASQDSEIAKIINKANCGFVVNHGDNYTLTKLILNLYYDKKLSNKLGENSLEYITNYHTKDNSIKQLLNCINNIINETY